MEGNNCFEYGGTIFKASIAMKLKTRKVGILKEGSESNVKRNSEFEGNGK